MDHETLRVQEIPATTTMIHILRSLFGTHRICAFPLELAAFLLMSTSAMGATSAIADCFDTIDSRAAKACHLQALAAYQALQVAQVKYGMTGASCQFGADVIETELLTQLAQDYPRIKDRLSKYDVTADIVVALLRSPAKCTLGTAKKVDGLDAGSLLSMCALASKDSGVLDGCGAYLRGLIDALNFVSAYKGAHAFFCSPISNISVSEATSLFIKEMKRDPKKQQTRAAAEVMSDALVRNYPCRAKSPGDYSAIMGRVLAIIEQHDGHVSTLVVPTDSDLALISELKPLRPVIVKSEVPTTAAETLPRGYLLIENIGSTDSDAKFVGTLGPGALAGTLGADDNCGLRYTIIFGIANGGWQAGPYSSRQCSVH
jgi:hypothetical protein